MFLDTDVLIWGLKQDTNAVRLLDGLDDIRIPSVVYMELIQGARNKKEQHDIVKAMNAIDVQIFHINRSISQAALKLVREFALSHALYLADALIAATAVHYRETLITANDKHYRVVPQLTLQIFRPAN